MNDIAYCTEDNCRITNCIRNHENITDHGILHQWVNKEDVPECPFNQKLKYTDQDTFQGTLMPAT